MVSFSPNLSGVGGRPKPHAEDELIGEVGHFASDDLVPLAGCLQQSTYEAEHELGISPLPRIARHAAR
jgi:hypothetical protein